MRSIGIRVSPTIVYFTVVEYVSENQLTILTTEQLIVPKSMDIPDQLSYIRTTLFSIICEYNIVNAGIRRMEENSQRKVSMLRLYIEGVVQELISNCSIQNYFSGQISKVSSLLSSKQIKSCIDGQNIFNIDEWNTYGPEIRESILWAFAATQLKRSVAHV